MLAIHVRIKRWTPLLAHQIYVDQEPLPKFISKLDKKLRKAGFTEPPEYDSTDDIKYIKNSLKFKIPDNLSDKDRKKYMKDYEDFIKNIKKQVDEYVFNRDGNG